ncbi:MAG: DUF4352 domain-containing protein [Acidimicrobiales bacterium]
MPTKLTCVHCRTPICPSCFVRTPVGLQCQMCSPDVATRRRPGRGLRAAAAVAAVAAVGLAVVAPRLIGGSDEPEASDAETSVDASAPDAALGQEANVGPIAVIVSRVDCPGSQLGTPPVTRTSAAGKFCAVYLTARNTGIQPEVFAASVQLLTDGVRRYAADLPPSGGGSPPTTLVLDDGVRELLGVRLNPDQRAGYAMVFDVPADFTPAQLLLRFTPRSPFVRVNLTPA